MVNILTNSCCPFLKAFFILMILNVNNFVYGLNSVHLKKRNEFFITESPNRKIQMSRQKENSDSKESEDFDYSDDYKDILFVNSQNTSQNLYNLTEKINNKDSSEFETYEDPDLSETTRPEILRQANPSITVKTANVENSTHNVIILNKSQTPSLRDIYYDEKDADYYLRNDPKKDYIATVTVPTVIVVSVILAILYALLHLPKCCFGFFYEPSYQSYYQKNAALAAKEQLHQEFLDED